MEKCARILMLDKELIKHLKGQTCALHNGSIENKRCARIQSATGNVRDERVRYTTVLPPSGGTKWNGVSRGTKCSRTCVSA